MNTDLAGEHNEHNVKALSSKQERKLMKYLDERFLEITRGFKKRFQPDSVLPTLPSYLEATRSLLALILQIPPVDPSTSLRTAFLLRLTGDALSSITGYPIDPETLPELLEWLDDLDEAWVAVLQSQIWDPTTGLGVDLVLDVSVSNAKSTPLSQTERTRLYSLLLGGGASLEEWLTGTETSDASIDDMMKRLSVQQEFNELFSQTLQELGALGNTKVNVI